MIDSRHMPTFCRIPGGSFLMGSSPDDPNKSDDEIPQHEVKIDPFLMSATPITQCQWRFVAALTHLKQDLNLDLDPSSFHGDDLPVENVNWFDAVEFCQRLSRYAGRKYRLPSEAEWEYACRAGTTTTFYFGETTNTDLANYGRREHRKKTTPVGFFPANAFGLYDMHGNVWEWCLDPWHDNYNGAPTDGSAWIDPAGKVTVKVARGGCWYSDDELCASAYRNYRSADSRDSYCGFRIVCDDAQAEPIPEVEKTQSKSSSLPFFFPLRPGLNAKLLIPRDLTTAEVKRLAAFLQTLAVDHKPE